MIEILNSHTVRLVPDTPTKRPAKKMNALERQVIASMKSAMYEEARGQLFLRRQIALADRYAVAVEARGKLKTVGPPGFVSIPAACKVVKPR